MGKSSVSLRQRPRLHVESFEDRRLLSAGSLVLQLAPQWLRSEPLLRSFDARSLALLDPSPRAVIEELTEKPVDSLDLDDGDLVRFASVLKELRERGEGLADNEDGQEQNPSTEKEDRDPALTNGAVDEVMEQALRERARETKPRGETPRPNPANDPPAAEPAGKHRSNSPLADHVDTGEGSAPANGPTRPPLIVPPPTPSGGGDVRDHDRPAPLLQDSVPAPREEAAFPRTTDEGGPYWGIRPGSGEGDARPASQGPQLTGQHPDVPAAADNVPTRLRIGHALPLVGAGGPSAARGQDTADSQQSDPAPVPAQELIVAATTPSSETRFGSSHATVSQAPAELMVAVVPTTDVAEGAPAPVQQANTLSVGAYVPAVAGLLEAVAPFDRDAVQAAMRQFLEQVENLGGDASSWLAQMNLSPWVVGMALGLTAYDVARRRRQTQRGLALTDDDGTPITWFPGLAGVWNVQDA